MLKRKVLFKNIDSQNTFKNYPPPLSPARKAISAYAHCSSCWN